MFIKEIDLILFKQSVLYRCDITDKYVSQKQFIYQKIKVFYLVFRIILHIFRYILYLIKSKNGFLPILITWI